MEKVKLAPNLSKLGEDDYASESGAIIAAVNTHATVVPGLNPTPAAVKTKWDDRNLIKLKKIDLLDQVKQCDADLEASRIDITNDLTDSWAPQIQKIIAGDVGLAHLLRFHIIGSNPPPPTPPESVALCTKIDINIPGKHTIHTIDSITQKKALPKDILRCEVYGQTGGIQPTNLPELITNGGGRVGEIDKGKFVNELPAGNKGKTEYYILVYISKKTKKPFSYSIVYSATIT